MADSCGQCIAEACIEICCRAICAALCALCIEECCCKKEPEQEPLTRTVHVYHISNNQDDRGWSTSNQSSTNVLTRQQPLKRNGDNDGLPSYQEVTAPTQRIPVTRTTTRNSCFGMDDCGGCDCGQCDCCSQCNDCTIVHILCICCLTPNDGCCRYGSLPIGRQRLTTTRPGHRVPSISERVSNWNSIRNSSVLVSRQPKKLNDTLPPSYKEATGQ